MSLTATLDPKSQLPGIDFSKAGIERGTLRELLDNVTEELLVQGKPIELNVVLSVTGAGSAMRATQELADVLRGLSQGSPLNINFSPTRPTEHNAKTGDYLTAGALKIQLKPAEAILKDDQPEVLDPRFPIPARTITGKIKI